MAPFRRAPGICKIMLMGRNRLLSISPSAPAGYFEEALILLRGQLVPCYLLDLFEAYR